MTEAELVKIWYEVYSIQRQQWAFNCETVADMVVLNLENQ